MCRVTLKSFSEIIQNVLWRTKRCLSWSIFSVFSFDFLWFINFSFLFFVLFLRNFVSTCVHYSDRSIAIGPRGKIIRSGSRTLHWIQRIRTCCFALGKTLFEDPDRWVRELNRATWWKGESNYFNKHTAWTLESERLDLPLSVRRQ